MTNELKRIQAKGENSYEILLGRGLLDEVSIALGTSVKKVLLVYPEPLEASAQAITETLTAAGKSVWQFPVVDGESAKADRWLTIAWSSLGQAEFSRSDAVVSIGGGSTTDLAGFIAATWLRGIKVVHIPTTLLAMVDASIGGKTGINTLEGKNLVGAFHDPAAVIADLDTLETLAKVELGSGFGEIVKCGFIKDPTILDLIEENVSEAVDVRSDRFFELVNRTIQVKVDTVSSDFRESGAREFLNYGHTLGHAIELAEHYKMKHGHAVAIGMCFVAELARSTGRLDDATADRHKSILQLIGLPISYPKGKWPALYTGMQVDKKSRGGLLRFVVLDGLAKPGILEAPTEEVLYSAFLEIAE
jgi:3-dehydroquinate synthase